MALAAQWVQLVGAIPTAAYLGLGLAGRVAAVPEQASDLLHWEAKLVCDACARGSLGWMATRPRAVSVEALLRRAGRADVGRAE